MADLAEFAAQILSGGIEVVDLTSPLHANTPILQLPPQWGQTQPFQLEEISRYDDRGPAWYWNDIRTGEHTGTHVDAPVHWVTGRDGLDVSQAPMSTLVAPVAVIDKSAAAAADPDFLLEVEHITAWQDEHGPLPEGGWLLYRTGWAARGARVGAHGLHAEAGQRRLLGQPARALGGDAGGVRAVLVGVEEGRGVLAAGLPAGPVEQPTALGQRAVLVLPGGDVLDLQQEV